MTDATGETKTILISVKGGHVTVSPLRDLRGVIERDQAAIGVFICIEEPTAPKRKEAADAGFFQAKSWPSPGEYRATGEEGGQDKINVGRRGACGSPGRARGRSG
jgi:hypothetical protein